MEELGKRFIQAVRGEHLFCHYLIAIIFVGSATIVIDPASASNHSYSSKIIQSDQVESWQGYTVDGAGDVNGDGYDDLLVNTTKYSSNGLQRNGRVYVYFGSADGVKPDDPGKYWYVDGDQSAVSGNEVLFGWEAVGGADFNRDGYDDIVIAARNYDSSIYSDIGRDKDEGKVYVYFGGPDFKGPGSSTRVATTADADWTAESNQGDAFFGIALAVADVNGDLYSDVLIGAAGYDTSGYDPNATPPGLFGSPTPSIHETDEGKVFVYYGGPSSKGPGSTTKNATLADADWSAQSNQTGAKTNAFSVPDGAFFGRSIESCDLNGDNRADVIVGARFYDGETSVQTDEGGVFVYYSGAAHNGPGGNNNVSTADADWQAEGNASPAYFGSHVSCVGDVNADGFTDLMIGAYAYGDIPHSNFIGGAFIYHGSLSGLSAIPTTTDRPTVTANWSVVGNHDFAWLGSAAAGIDYNKDGVDDLLLGCEQCDDNLSDVYSGGGAVYVYPGKKNTGLETTPIWTNSLPSGSDTSLGYSGNTGARYGSWLANAGDINKDGYEDFVVTAYVVDRVYLNTSCLKPQIQFSDVTHLVTGEAGDSATFSVWLDRFPTGTTAELKLSSSDVSEGKVSPAKITFTDSNWNQPQAITVTGIDDTEEDGDVSYTIATAPLLSGSDCLSGIDAPDVNVTNQNNDAPPVANFSDGQILVEGNVVKVLVSLSHLALDYPVVIPYTLDGASTTATFGDDHNASPSGTIEISSGMVGELTFNTVADEREEGDEVIMFVMGSPTNAVSGLKSTHKIILKNIPPEPVSIKVSGDVGGGGAIGWYLLALYYLRWLLGLRAIIAPPRESCQMARY